MKKLFLTSSPTGPLDGSRPVAGLDEWNDFVANLKKVWKESSRCLMIAASPDCFRENEEMTSFFAGAVKRSGLSVSSFDMWDHRTTDVSEEALCSYDVIFLGGGHVPTQNAFFQQIGLREKIRGFEGIVIGISAGSMNSADEVYAQPELPGESEDSSYLRFLPGLNLTKTMILPHYQMVKDTILDGKRLFEEITYPDSLGREFLILPDGSYLMSIDGRESVWGEAWLLKDGKLEPYPA
ncbi:MAG: Type 1 glutamine amidotransferase-like domain-containing protein [Clostridium sp.]|nr:Type 1 glutamine amidotransferase-like domain-containing protein [Clostridium sp.]